MNPNPAGAPASHPVVASTATPGTADPDNGSAPRQRELEPFLVTKEHRKFVEFADACRRHRYIGVCYGPPGVGKTLSAATYAHAATIQPYLRALRNKGHSFSSWSARRPPPDLDSTRTALWTPGVTNSPSQLTYQVAQTITELSTAIQALHAGPFHASTPLPGDPYTELLIVDESDRLKAAGLEHLRDVYDRRDLGLILIGMPGLEKRLARYPQLYSRIGFAHHYQPLTGPELTGVLTSHWQRLSSPPTPDDPCDADALAAAARITAGNFRLIQRLFTQVERILQINDLTKITREVLEAAREALVIGA